MNYRIAGVSFLNTWPLVDALEELAPGRVRLTFAVPSDLPELLHADEADVALIPVVETFRGVGAGIVPGVGICTPGRVDSVVLYSTVHPTEIEHVAVDRGSRTSVALLRVLFAELWGVQPDFKVLSPQVETLLDDEQAVLVIGDRCFAAERRFREEGRDDVHRVDLGDVWRQMTGLPFVFAVWCLGEGFLSRASDAERHELIGLLRTARDRGLERVDALAARAVAENMLGPHGTSSVEAIRRYFTQSLNYVMGRDELAAISRFHMLCVRHQIVPAAPQPRIAADEESA
jgi:chorismate dehydratase